MGSMSLFYITLQIVDCQWPPQVTLYNWSTICREYILGLGHYSEWARFVQVWLGLQGKQARAGSRDSTGTVQGQYRDTTGTLQGHYRDTQGHTGTLQATLQTHDRVRIASSAAKSKKVENTSLQFVEYVGMTLCRLSGLQFGCNL